MEVELVKEALLKHGVLSESQWKKIEEEYNMTGVAIEKLLQTHKICEPELVYQTLAEHLNVPYIDLFNYTPDPELIAQIPESFARQYLILPLFRVSNMLSVAMANPRNLGPIDELRLKLGLEITPVLAGAEAILNVIDNCYNPEAKAKKEIQEVVPQVCTEAPVEDEIKTLEEQASEAPIVKFVNSIITEAIQTRASDIHFDPEENNLRIRFRIDGLLRPITEVPPGMKHSVISRIKILSKMNIADKRRPQDGQFEMSFEKKKVDFRVSTFPTIFGESCVIRILDKSSVYLGFSELGFTPENLLKFQAMIRSPYGIILVTGPTGSGKTTTLYSVLDSIRSGDKNIITLEDPVEYQLQMIRQSQVNPKAGLTFATGLRSILRQDPDVIMVGEIRDLETAEIAVQAALTGHLVFSTLHTNNAAGAITRLIDMAVEPFLVSSSLIGVLAQRLVRKLCPNCKEPFEPVAEIVKILRLGPKAKLYKPKGCNKCGETGFLGRTGIFELLVVDDGIKKLIVAKAPAEEIQKYAISRGLKTLRDDGLEKVRKGITTLEEVLRTTFGQ